MDGLVSFGVGALSCLILAIVAVLATYSAKIKTDNDDEVLPFKQRMKWLGFFLLYMVTFIISVPVGIVVIIVKAIKSKKEGQGEVEEHSKSKTNENVEDEGKWNERNV